MLGGGIPGTVNAGSIRPLQLEAARWRNTVPYDLDWMPQMSERDLLVRYGQKLGVLRWPASTLCFGKTVVAVIGCAPNDQGGVDLWSAFSPFAQLAGMRVARACKQRFELLRRAVGARPIVMEVDVDDAVAARFATFLGFKSAGTARRCDVTHVWMEVYKWGS